MYVCVVLFSSSHCLSPTGKLAAHSMPIRAYRSQNETGFHSNDVSFHVIDAAAAAHLRGNIADESAER